VGQVIGCIVATVSQASLIQLFRELRRLHGGINRTAYHREHPGEKSSGSTPSGAPARPQTAHGYFGLRDRQF